MAEQTRPTPEELWRQAGGGTPGYDRDRYRALLREHGHLIPLAPGETPQPLPCGWPTTPVAEQRCDVTELLVSQCAHCRKLPDPLADAQPEYGPAFEARYPGRCGECGLPIEPGEPIADLRTDWTRRCAERDHAYDRVAGMLRERGITWEGDAILAVFAAVDKAIDARADRLYELRKRLEWAERDRDEAQQRAERAHANRNAMAASLDRLYGGVERIADQLGRVPPPPVVGNGIPGQPVVSAARVQASLCALLGADPTPDSDVQVLGDQPVDNAKSAPVDTLGMAAEISEPIANGYRWMRILREGLTERDITTSQWARTVPAALAAIDSLRAEIKRLNAGYTKLHEDAQQREAALREQIERLENHADGQLKAWRRTRAERDGLGAQLEALRLELATMTRDRDEARANVAGLARRLRELEGRVSDTGRLRRLETALEGAVSRWRTKAVDSPMAHTRLIWQTAADTVAGLLLELAKSDPEGHDDRTAV